jgi:uncharacterized phiE125 gp8 family phage protein
MATSARIMAENYTRRAFITQSWMLSVDIDKVLDEITIPRPPLQSITGINIYGTMDALTIQNPLLYNTDTTSEPGRIYLKIGYMWGDGIAMRTRNCMQITYKSGYGDAKGDVPQVIQDSIAETAAYYFVQGTTGVLPPDVITKLQPYRIYL